MAAILGFAGLSTNGRTVSIRPRLPEKWESIAFQIVFRGQSFSVEAGKTGVRVRASDQNSEAILFNFLGQLKECRAGQEIQIG